MSSEEKTAKNGPASHRASDKELAADVIRAKIEQLYVKEQQEKRRDQMRHDPDATVVIHHHTKHQQYIHELTRSGLSLEEIQTSWHNYYVSLPDKEKHQVWQEFYDSAAKAKAAAAAPAPAPIHHKSPKPASARTIDQIKHQITTKANGGGKLKAKQHLQALGFGLASGFIVIVLLMFGFFNERVIAPFIQPSRTVSNTPIIVNAADAVSPNPEIIIPKINVQIPVIYTQPSVAEPDIEASLEQGVVHYATTPYPGQLGNGVIFGHSSNNILNPGKYKFAFVLLHTLNIGDTFYLTKDGKRYVYQVYKRNVVPPSDVSVLNTQEKPATFTLITCDPPGTSNNRLIVVGEQISPSPANNTASTAITASAQPAQLPSNSVSLWSRLTGWL